jgi:MoaA/NifB/PqqE/SkfB family radical SAM enzyme
MFPIRQNMLEAQRARLRGYLCRHYNLEERLVAFAERRFYSLEIELTNVCNQECLYCYNWSRRQSATPHLQLENVSRWLYEAHNVGVREIFWLGGEPLSYPHLEKVLEISVDIGMSNTILTNGTLLTPTKWSKLKPLVRRLIFHLDTIDPRTFCEINDVTPSQGRQLLARAIANLENIRSEGAADLDVILYLVLLRPTLATLAETLHWAFDKGLVDTTALYPMVRAGRAQELPADWALSLPELRKGFELRAEAERRPELLLLGPSEYCKHYQLTMAYIDVDGYLSPYAGITEPRFSTTGQDLGYLLSSHYEKLSFSNLGRPDPSAGLLEPCGGCLHSDLCFGTRTTAFNHLGSIRDRDPFCWLPFEDNYYA